VESRRVSRVLALLVGVGGLALSTSGCVIKDSSTPACFPDLTVRWRIVQSGSVVPPTCDEVGARTIRVSIGGEVTDLSCPAGLSMGSIPFDLAAAGAYPVTVTLLDGSSTRLAESSTSAIVDCGGLSQTQVIDLTLPPVGCSPDLTISWLLTSNIDGTALTCAKAGNADTVTAWIDGGGLGTTLTAFHSPCPANSDSGSFVALLPTSGTYDVSLELTRGDILLSETPILTKTVDCSGLSATPPAELFVNF
jgi:hypothetical protein